VSEQASQLDSATWAVYRYTGTCRGVTTNGEYAWQRKWGGRHAEQVVRDLMRRRFNWAAVTLDGVEVGGISQERERGPRQPWWDATV